MRLKKTKTIRIKKTDHIFNTEKESLNKLINNKI